MKFVNRNSEMNTLKKQYQDDNASLVVLYGRRRVGKTTLIEEFIKDKKALYFLATKEAESVNRETLRLAAADFLDNDLMRDAVNLSWDSIFKELSRASFDERVVLVIDEFQYLGSVNKAFPSMFQKYWDMYLSKSNVMVILCGSLINMMFDQTLKHTSPLYGRRTAQIKLKQIPFSYYGEFFPGKTDSELIELYSVTGGVPKYIKEFMKGTSLFDSVRDSIFNRDSYLYEEPNFLLNNEVSNTSTYTSIIDVVATRGKKMSFISACLEMNRQNVTHHMNTLMDLDLMRKVVPVTTKNPEKSKSVEFHVADNFFQFWFKFVKPFKGELERGHTESALRNLQSKFIDQHVSYVYEDVARKEILILSQEGVVPSYNSVGRWWDGTAEIDILAFNKETGRVLYGECKYKNSKIDMSDYRKLTQSAGRVQFDFAVEEPCVYIFFSKSGFSDELIELSSKDPQLKLIQGINEVIQ